MNKTSLSFTLAFLSTIAFGAPLQTAQQLARTLDAIQFESGKVAQRASQNGNYVRAQRFGDISFEAGQTERELRQGVVRPLRHGEPIHRVRQNLQGMNHQFRRLNDLVMQVNQMPITLENSIADAKHLHRELRQDLQGGGVIDPGGRLVQCQAADQGFEEHFLNPHMGYGRNVRDAERAALMECQRHHGRCRIVSCR